MRIRHRRTRLALAVLVVVLPARARRLVHTGLLGHRVDATASIGRSIVDVDHLEMGPGSQIGHLNIIRNCTEVRLDADAAIMTGNLVTSVPAGRGYFEGIDRRPALVLGRCAMVGRFHRIDCCDLVELGPWALLAGSGSTVQTHAIDIDAGRQSCRPIRVGDHGFVATRAVLLPGARVPDRAVVGAGAVVTGELTDRSAVFAGVPAREIRPLDPDSDFFRRRTTRVR